MQSEPEREEILFSALRGVAGDRHPIWQSLLTGGGERANEMLRSLQQLGAEFDHEVGFMVERVVSRRSQVLLTTRLILKTVAELHFKTRAPFSSVIEAGKSQGLGLCPVDAALALRFEYANLPNGERFLILSPPIDLAGFPYIFGVTRRASKIRLDAVRIGRSDLVNREDRLVFARLEKVERAD